MANGDVINTTGDVAANILTELGSIALWLQAVGVVVLLWIGFQIVNWVLNRKRLKRLDTLTERIDRIEEKIDKVLKKSK